jgi:energy-coupling factor transporter transmembrane protein EcfT
MTQTLKEKLSVKDKWIRLVFMILFAIVVYFVAIPLVWLIGAFQFIYSLFVGKALKTLTPFSNGLSEFIHQIMAFITYVTEEKPFPFSSWPGAKESAKAKPKPAPVAKKPPEIKTEIKKEK